MADELMRVDQATGEIQPHEQQGMGVEASRAMAESQAGFIIAQQYPRNREAAKAAIMRECESVKLAEAAEFSFPKGGTDVSGATIRLLEVIAQNWGNITSGIRELEELEGESVLQAYCYDLQTNVREERIFRVKHWIKTKKGPKYLDDPRDLYELKFNMGSRRKRACMENVIPRHIIEEAVEVCRETVKTKGTPPNEENIGKMIAAFEGIGVTEEMLEVRQQKKMKALTGPEFNALRRIFKGIDDGMTSVEKVFGDETLKQPTRKSPAGVPPEGPAEKKQKAATKKAKTTKKKATKDVGDPGGKDAGANTSEESPGEPPPGDQEAPPPDPPDSKAQGASSPLPSANRGEEPGDETTITDRIASVKFIKEGKTSANNPWKLYHVTTEGGVGYSCYNDRVIEGLESAVDNGYLVELEIKTGAKGKQIIGLELLG